MVVEALCEAHGRPELICDEVLVSKAHKPQLLHNHVLLEYSSHER